jgi:hypothetical protein
MTSGAIHALVEGFPSTSRPSAGDERSKVVAQFRDWLRTLSRMILALLDFKGRLGDFLNF